MKKLRGNLTIELEDVNTGTVETVSETNMVTNAVNDILGVNPMGVMYKAGGEYDDSLTWNNELLPICPNMIGGILLFSSAITEAVNTLYLPSTNLPVAYASNDVNATANVKRGSMNLTESMPLTDGYKFVWEFTPSQGDGTIAALGLTSKHGGANAYGSDVAVDTTLLQIKKVSLDDEDGFINDLFRTVTVDFENAKLYALCYASNTVTIKRYRIPVFDIGLNEKLDDSTLTLEDTTVLQCSTFKFYGSYTPYGIFCDGGDGYWYGFSNQANSSGSATMLWIKIRKSDYSYAAASYGVKQPDFSALARGFHFEDYVDVLLKELSTGNLKKAYLMTAFALHPKLLLLDEPVNGLDFQSTEYLYELIGGYRKYGTILFSSHILESICLTSDRVLVLEQGRIRNTFVGAEINSETIREVLKE